MYSCPLCIELVDQKTKEMVGKWNARWPFYEDWCDIYGKDRARGRGARAFDDAIETVLAGGRENEEDNILNDEDIIGTQSETVNTCTNSVGGDTNIRAAKRPRRGHNLVGQDVAFVDAFKGFVELTKQTIGTMQNGRTELSVEYCRLHLWEELQTYPGLTLKTLMQLGKRISNNDNMLQYFFTLPKEARFEFIVEELGNMHIGERCSSGTSNEQQAGESDWGTEL